MHPFRWLGWLLDTRSFTPCGTDWPAPLTFATQIGDGLIAVAFLVIPLALVTQAVRLRGQYRHILMWLFSGFIISGGLLHALHFAEYWWPAYRLDAALRLCTAGISLATAVVLVPFVRGMVRRHNDLEQHAGELERELQQRRHEEAVAKARTREAELAVQVLAHQQARRSRNVLTKASESIETWLVGRD